MVAEDGVAAPHVELRELTEGDLPVFFDQTRDPVAVHMAAFTAPDPDDHDAFLRHWRRVLADGTTVRRSILADGALAGHILRYTEKGRGEVTCWLGREYWGKGIATSALSLFILDVDERPLYARAAADNFGSLRVLQKCGFVVLAESTGYAAARSANIREYLLVLS